MTEPAVWPGVRPATLGGLLRARAAERPERVAFTFLKDGELEEARLTYGELDRRARAIARELAKSVAPGERALLLYPPGLELIAAFFGCLYAGAVAVPAYPPRPNDRSQTRLRAIVRDATPQVALTTVDILAGVAGPRGLSAVAPELAAVGWLPTDTLAGEPGEDGLPEPDPSALAFLQYTSGSTAAPKGVKVTHANLLHNERMIGEAFGQDEETVVVGWLPLYHDMGLIGNVLQPVHAGGRCVLMSPVAFLQRPLRWLQAISRFRGTTSGGPNFAYELCVRKATPDALAGLDLSCWRVAYNGAEPVRAETLERFAAVFAPCGFRPEAFYPCYGLAEATLFVSGGSPGAVPRTVEAEETSRRLVSCGHAWGGQRIVVADPETGTERVPGEVGEIWVSGPSVAAGYWNQPEATERDFNAFLLTPDGRGDGPFLRTGDLGFLAGGELFVTGRLKDLVILRGRNHYPQDLELTAEQSHPDLRPGNAAAFPVEIRGEERLVIAIEVERRRRDDFAPVAEAVRRAVAAEHEVAVHEVVLLRLGGLPKTSSGKVQRRLCRSLYLAGELPVVGRSALAAEERLETGTLLTRGVLLAAGPGERSTLLEGWLVERAAAALGTPSSAISLEQPLTGLGLDSLSAIELKGSVEAELGLSVPLADLLQGIGIRALAARILEGVPLDGETPPRALGLPGDQPLSAGQKGIWFLDRLAPEAGAYNIVVAARARGLDAAALKRALAALVVRHEALRTVFPAEGGEPMRRVGEGEIDFGVIEEGDLNSEAFRPFDLEAGPLVRVRVLMGPGEERVLLFAVHHLAADFASLAVAARELSALYRQETGGPAAGLPPVPLSYSDFVHWQAERLAGPRGERLAGFWREHLAGVPDLDLPTDHPRPPVQTFRGGARAALLPPDLVAGMKALGASRGATLFHTLFAAFAVQLGRLSGQEGFAIGTPTAGRPVPELAGLVGYLVNPVALRADLSGEPGFETLLERARDAALAGLEHAELPFPMVAERLRPVRDPARSPVYQAMLVLQSGRGGDDPGLAAFSLGVEGARIGLGGLALEPVPLPERRALVDLALFAAEDGRGGLAVSLEHNADLFDGETAERLLGHLQILLAGAVAAPKTPVWSLPLLTAAERSQLFHEWIETARPYPRHQALHRMFEERAARDPGAEVLVAGELRLTAAELNRRANRLAHRLRDLGVGPEARVGICLPRSERMIVALLGILKAGGAYVPLDPAYPAERLELMLADSDARVMVSETGTAARLGPFAGPLVLLDQEGEGLESDPAPLAGPDNLAYLIYTSGSTGRPKAVAIEHRSAVALVHWAREVYPPEDLAGVLAATSIAFDLSVFEIFVPLAWGGRVILAENALALPRLPAAGEVTLVNTVPSAMAELVRGGGVPSSVRVVNLAGEPIPLALVAAIHGLDPRPRLYNLYGPSEDTTYSTFARLETGSEAPIGVPVANTRVHLLDARGEPVPVGVPGELLLGGEGLARGYLGRPELTAERFVPDPFAAERGARLYRTGDLARWRRGGDLEFLGRIDHQVKVRGFRIELGEVEAALVRHPAVRDAVVVAKDDGEGGKRLVAYVAPRGVSSAELRSHLRAALPEHMVPAAFVRLDALPLSPNGKVDRKALPDPGAAAGERTVAAAPGDPREELIAGAFAEVLGLDRVSRDDDFFALGGHSLLATRLVARVARLFGMDLPVSVVFLHPTPAGLAALVPRSVPLAPPLVPLPRDGSGLPLSFAQRRLWFLDRLTPASAVYNLPGAVRLSGALDLPVLAAALLEIVRRHEALRTVFRVEGGEPVQVVTPPAVPLPLIDLSDLPTREREAEAARLSRQQASEPFDLAAGPLCRTLAVRLAPAEHRLLVTLHHIVADGWSLAVFLGELTALYETFAAGRPSPLPDLPVQPADHAAWQQAWLAGGVLAAQVEWWRARLAGVPVLDLPTDRPRPAVRSLRGGTRTALLPVALAEEIDGLARREGVTPFMALLAAFATLLGRWAGADVVPVGTPVANRGRVETEGLIGFFVNTLALPVSLEGGPTFRTLLARVREVCLGAWEHADVPFERLVEELRPERHLAQNPLFQVVFLLEEPLPRRTMGGVAVEPRRVETGTAKFDLTLGVAREDRGLAVTVEHDSTLFDPATADRLLGHWRTLLEGIAADPAAQLVDLPLLTGAEAEQLRVWSGVRTDYPREATLHELFAAQARRAPDAVALEVGEERLTYGELEARANRLARRLRRHGVGPEVPVGLAIERGVGMIVGMLGILKAGGAYVPLDPDYPAARLAFMVEDAGLALVVAREVLLQETVLIDDGGLLLEGEESAAPLDPVGDAGGLAYVMYTSGSTGRPKGVEVVHRAVARLVLGTGFARFGRHEVFLQLAPASFDAATLEVWGALLHGARLALLPGRLPSLEELGAAVARHRVTTLWLTAGLFHQMVDSRVEGLAGLSQLLAGGDVLSPSHVRRALAALPGTTLINGYGPTENTTFTCCHPLRDAGAVGSHVPIGRPIANTTVHLLDRELRPVPVGVPGELYTGGDGLARGYRRRPELTAERFVPHPFPGVPGERLYRTGDLARYLPDGTLEFLGRRDRQVKIRGFRIEPAEVEAVLASHPGVREAALVVRDLPGGRALTAYLVPREGDGLPADLPAFLRDRLPEYMVPAFTLVLPELPLDPNGKVDRRALAARGPEPAGPAFVAPRTALEQRLAGIWSEVLGVAAVGIHDDFFALGGHSLLGLRVLARIKDVLGIDLPVGELFHAPTVAGLAEVLAGGRSTPAAPRPQRAAGTVTHTELAPYLTSLWSEVLGCEVGPDDDFFALGGQSLLALRVLSRLRDDLGVDLTMAGLFAAPTVHRMAQRLAAESTALIPAAPDPESPGDTFPLSFAQQRLWFIDRLAPGNPAYNLYVAARFRGHLKPGPLARALAEIVRRHEPLRTVYAQAGDGEPVQVVLPPASTPLPRVDLSGLPETSRKAALAAAVRDEAARPFDLERGPVARFLLVTVASREHVLVAAFHHIATDGWSMGVFSRELTALYAAFLAGRPSPLPDLPFRYGELARRQRRDLAEGALAPQLAYWRHQLAGVPVLESPTDRPRPAAPGGRGRNRAFTLPADLVRDLHRLALQERGTLFMALLGGYVALLARLSGQDDFAVGLPAAGRKLLAAEGMIGFFVNTLVLRARTGDDLGFAGLFGQVRDTVLAAQANQDVPFERLVEELQPERSTGVSPLFQTMFAFLSHPGGPLSIPGLEVELLDVETTTVKYDLTLSLLERDGAVSGWMEFRSELYEAATIDRWLSHLRVLLAAAVAEPGRRLSELPLLTGPERRQLLEWGVAPPEDEAEPVPAAFSHWVRTAPQAPAVGGLSYDELEERANRLARRLIALEVGAEDRVAVCLDRSPDLIVALLAVLKAGAAYVPLDPAHPHERLAFVLADSGAALLISRSGLLATGLRTLLLDVEAGVIAAESAEDPRVPIDPDHLAYVLYTSGSTGRPKGVGVSHGALARHLAAVRRLYGLAPADRVLQFAAAGFDVSLEQVLGALTAGASLVLRGDEPWGSAELADRIAALGLTVVNLPTAVWHRFVDDAPAAPPSLRLLIAGGEEMLPAAVRRWRETALAGVRLLNAYGPTEAVITATCHEVGDQPAGRPVPVGMPLPGRAAHVLDRHGNPQPVGVPGELCLGGVLARGYLGRPDLTAASFVPDPFAARPGGRLYRTGDLARRLPDGTLEFLGRRDGQVKIRGIRIETAEIESALLAHPGVRQAVVLAVASGEGDRRLAAWVVPVGPAEEAPPPAAALREFLAARVPAAMVPAFFTPLAALPLTPNGKVDRTALPQPASISGSEVTRAATLTEELLAGLWADVLGVERVGPEDGFFDLGGHSLSATRLISRVRAAFGVDVPLAALFAAPTPAGLARTIEALQEQDAAAAPPLVRRPRAAAGAPLSFAQQRLWFLSRLEPESPAYNVPGALALSGPLRPAVLAAALAEIVRRHEALRTVFALSADADREPVQVVLPPPPVHLPVVDLSVLPEDVRQDEAARLLRDEADRPFDLMTGPLVRTALLALAPGEHLLAVALHHVISDAWSLGLMLRELAVLYRSFAAGEPSPLPELPLQYADYAEWQRTWLTGDVLARELAHWRRALAGAPAALELPGDRSRPAVPRSPAGHRPFSLPAGASADLAALGRRQGWTPFMGLLAAFDALLSRWSGQRDLVVGSPIANRNRLETEGLIGFFTNTLALRVDLHGDPDFAEIARRARAAALAAYAHQSLPFERLVEELAPERHLGRTPLFQVMLVLRNTPVGELDLPGVRAELVDVPLTVAKFDLTLFLTETPDGLAGSLEFDRDLFDPATADRLLGHFATLLAGAVAAPETRLADLPLLTAAERAELLAWGSHAVGHPCGLVHGLVAAQAARTPEADAVVHGEARLTYRELMERAGRLARRLSALGVRPDVPVGVLFERSPELWVAVLAALQAGGAYLPLDPSYPAERLRLMIEDSAAPVVITSDALAGLVPAGVQALGLDVQDDAADFVPALPDNLAYVVYTSGSTGRPKGVGMPHGAAVNLLAWQRRTSVAGEGTRTLQFAPVSFDVSFQEAFSTWATGGTLVLVSEETRRDPAALLGLLAEERVERLFVPLVALQQIAVAAQDQRAPESLREVMTAGEQLYVTPQVRALFTALPGAVLYNHYGPSETHAATWLPLAGDPVLWPERPTIGGPLDNARVVLLDHSLAAVPRGVPGELYIGGEGLARGYLGRPDLTAERFLPDPAAGTAGIPPGARLYRTGDLARWRDGGLLDFLGRGDHQVKVRGYRIELAEVESALACHPAVLQAAVAVTGEGGAGAKRLVAYVVFREGVAAPAWSELKTFLAGTLPAYMVPAVWVPLAALPLTASGKLDRRALPAPEEVTVDEPALPSTPVEELVAGIWGDVLGIDRVGVHDSFFDLGGHSLLATQVVSRLREACGVDLPLRRLFEAPTVAELARAIETARSASLTQDVEAIPRTGRDGRLPLSFAQERLWFLDRFEGGGWLYNVPLAVRLEGWLDVPLLGEVLAGIVRRHETLRTTFPEQGGEPVQVIAPPTAVGRALSVADLTGLPAAAREAERRRLTGEESRRPFDLTTGPLLRAALLRLGEEEHTLLLTLHHIVADIWSLGVLVREVAALYGGSPLPELPVQYADFAVWQRRWLSGDRLERQMGYWRWQLQGAPAQLDLTTDFPRPAVRGTRGAEHHFAVDAGLFGRLTALSRREGVTPFMVLAAGLFTLLARATGQSDVTIGAPIANRNRLETEGLIGFFVNTLVLRADLQPAATFRDLLRQVRETTLGAYAHQDLPFEKLVEELSPQRDLSRTPLFQVVLALQNAPFAAHGLPGLTLRPEEGTAGTAKFDLAFVLSPAGEGLAGVIEYATDLFASPSPARLAEHLLTLLAAAAADPGAALSALPLLSEGARHQVLHEWNDTDYLPADDPRLHEMFEAWAAERPEALAAVWQEEEITYGALNARADRVARLLARLGVEPAQPVGVWMERSIDLLTAVLGIVKAGYPYLPLDASWPAERVETILARTGTAALVTGSSRLSPVAAFRWRLPRLRDVVVLDVDTPRPAPEPLDTAGVRSLWDFVAERAVDRETAGGFISSETGLPFSPAEVDEYRDRVVSLAAPWVRPGARVLEIGCGSGLVFWEIAPRVARAVGLDPSPLTQERNRATAARLGLSHIELPAGFAEEIADWPAGTFDLVVLASTVQFFPGPLYLEDVLREALRLLAPGGAVVVADVIDARVGSRAGDGRELALDEGFFRDLSAFLPELGEVAVERRTEGFANELGLRYDVVLTRAEEAAPTPRKRLWTGWHVERAERAPAGRLPALPPPGGDDLAYVIHTSGSTGVPKGIVVRHRSAVNTLRWVNRTYGVGPGDRLLFVTSPCFDLSVYDIFGTLGAGATIHVASEAELKDPERLLHRLVSAPITIWNSAPAALQQLAPLFPPPELRGVGSRLRLAMLSGDWIPLSLPDQVRASFPGTELVNYGGATEGSVWSNWYPIGAVDPAWTGIPYGRPISNNRYYVLDGELAPCPVGIPGDLYLGGDGLCVGYAGLPERTAEKFIPDPFSGRAGARMYNMGDRGRFRDDGNMEFLGRRDFQVKIRGYRIELEEIEAALLRHEGVREAVVVAREDVGGEKRLVGYVVPSRVPAPEPGELRAVLQQTLPDYMVPWTFVLLPALPLNTNGKVDRRALPAPQAATAAVLEEGGRQAPASIPPRNELERAIAAVWREVLGVEQVGIADNFFEVGGSSLLIVKLHSRLKAALGVDVPVMELFRYTTIDALAQRLAEEKHEEKEEEKVEKAEAARARTRGRQEALRQLSQTRAQRRGERSSR